MKQWKLLLAALLCVLLVSISVGALADTVKCLVETQIVRVDGDAAHHKVIKWYVDKDTTTGDQIGEKYGEISWEGHKLSVFVKEVPSTCVTKGYSIMECEDCHFQQKYELPLVAHKWTPIAAKPATCGEDGNKAGQKCSVCGLVQGAEKIPMPAAEHSPKVASSVAAKCLENGRMHLVCQICFKEWDEIIPKLGHVFDDSNWVVVQPATCENPGVRYRYCINPDCEYYESDTLPALGHNFDTSVLSAIRSGCVAGDKYDDYTTIITPSTCTTAGKARLQCRNVDTNGNPCLAVKDYDIPAGHVMGAWYEDTSYYTGIVRCPCTDDLIYTRDCVKGCGYQEHQTIATAIGHSWIIVTLDETTGEGTRKCANCGAFEAFHITIGPNELVNPETPTEEDPAHITPDPTERPLDIEEPTGGQPADPTDPPAPGPVDPTEPPAPGPVDPTEPPAPVVRPAVYRTQGVVAENPDLASKRAVISVQNFAKGATYKVNLVNAEGKLLGYLVFTVKKDAVEATYKVTDVAGKEIAVTDESVQIRVYDYLSDAEALNDEYWVWTPSMTLYAVDPTANNLQVYLVMDSLSL